MVVRTSAEILGAPEGRAVEPALLEAGVLDRTRPQRRKFRRLSDTELAGFLAG